MTKVLKITSVIKKKKKVLLSAEMYGWVSLPYAVYFTESDVGS